MTTLIATATPTPTLVGFSGSSLTALPSALASLSVLPLASKVRVPPEVISSSSGI
ncbi:MAG: hypothetical protein ACOX3R_02245 [Desulfitobacteriia bacterium]